MLAPASPGGRSAPPACGAASPSPALPSCDPYAPGWGLRRCWRQHSPDYGQPLRPDARRQNPWSQPPPECEPNSNRSRHHRLDWGQSAPPSWPNAPNQPQLRQGLSAVASRRATACSAWRRLMPARSNSLTPAVLMDRPPSPNSPCSRNCSRTQVGLRARSGTRASNSG